MKGDALQPGRRRSARSRIFVILASLTLVSPQGMSAQLTAPCRAACGVVLGATAITAATGAAVAVGRHNGGVSTAGEGLVVWGAALGLVTGAGMALNGNGERQRRAVYGAGIGTAVGSLLWLGLEAAVGGTGGPNAVAAALMGAAAGAIVGGVYGALSHDERHDTLPVPVLSLSLRL